MFMNVVRSKDYSGNFTERYVFKVELSLINRPVVLYPLDSARSRLPLAVCVRDAGLVTVILGVEAAQLPTFAAQALHPVSQMR